MDIITIKLIENKLNLPVDISRYINEFVKYEILTNENIRDAVDLWCTNEELCEMQFGHISCWNTSKITNMSWLFFNKQKFNTDISRWNVSNVTDMRGMFYYARSFNQNISKWNISKCTLIYHTFCCAYSLDYKNKFKKVRKLKKINF